VNNPSFDSSLKKDFNLNLIARQVVEGFLTGLHKSPFHGFSVEFAEHRLYNPGESIRSIDWKLFARNERLFVKKYEEETNLRCQIILDQSSSMYYPEGDHNKIEFSVKAIASLIYLLQKQRDAFGLSKFSNIIEANFPCHSTLSHLKILFGELEKSLTKSFEPRTTSVTESLHILAETFHKRSMVIIFSDLLDSVGKIDELFSALQHLKYNKHEVLIFHVLDHPKELNFKFNNQPYQFFDLETNRSMKVNPLQVREYYQKTMLDFQKKLKERAGTSGIDFIETDIGLGFETVLLNYLLKRNRMNA